ncbi:MAG: DUF4339 domain-containing protein [Bacteroidales bacterium]|nr:DUF4339 domain-containing protein [Bacteroidales bacterium]
MNKYWIIKGSRQEGPFTLEQLKVMSLPADIPVWREGLTDWTHAYDVPELAPWTSFETEPVDEQVEEIVAVQETENEEHAQASPEVAEEVDEVILEEKEDITDNTAVPHPRPEETQGTYRVYPRKREPAKQESEMVYAPIGEVPEGYMPLAPETGKPKCPKSYLVLSIISTLLFFLPLGICAIFCSAKVEPHYQAGRYEQAYKMSNRAQLFIVLSIVCMLIWLPFSIIFAML